MFTILGHLAGALGLFFMGASLLTEHLKVLANRRVRLSAARWTGNRCLGFAWGLVTGSVMQSMTVLTLVAVSLLKSDLVSPKRTFPILLGGNVGGALLVLIVMLDIKLIALYVLGIAQVVTLVMARDRAVRDRAAPYRAMATACFGLGLIVFGSIMLKESVVPLAALPWFQQSLQWVGSSLVMPLLVGAALVFAVQSPLPVILSGIAMATAGLVTVEQVLMLHYGGGDRRQRSPPGPGPGGVHHFGRSVHSLLPACDPEPRRPLARRPVAADGNRSAGAAEVHPRPRHGGRGDHPDPGGSGTAAPAGDAVALPGRRRRSSWATAVSCCASCATRPCGTGRTCFPMNEPS